MRQFKLVLTHDNGQTCISTTAKDWSAMIDKVTNAENCPPSAISDIQTLCDCGHWATSNGITTGYGVSKEGKLSCFACCGEEDKTTLRETGILNGYLSKDEGRHYFSNWPGTLKLRVQHISKSRHNFAGKDGRTDFWLYFEGNQYHGVQIGHNHQCATIRRNKVER